VTAKQYLGSAGLLAALFAAVTQGCANPPKLPTQAEVAAVVAQARAATEKDCPKALAVCAMYFDAAKVGLVKEDDRAELACAQAGGVCSLVGAAGAPER
jgi:hypothetical protein